MWYDFTSALILGAILILFIFLWKKNNGSKGRKNDGWSEHGVKKMNGPSLLSSIFSKNYSFVGEEVKLYEQLEEGTKIGWLDEMGSPTLYVKDFELAQHIFVKDFDHFVDRRTIGAWDQELHMSDLLFNMTGDKWRAVRAKTNPAFTPSRLKRMHEVFQSSCDKLIKTMKNHFKSMGNTEGDIKIQPFLQKFTMDVIANVAFGLEAGVYENENSEFMEAGTLIQSEIASLSMLKFLLLTVAPKLCKIFNIKFIPDKVDKFFSSIIIQTLKYRSESGERREDFIQQMLDARREHEEEKRRSIEFKDTTQKGRKWTVDFEFSDDLIISQCIGFFADGFDTVETFLSWTLYELARNQHIQEKLYNDIQSKLEESGGKINYDLVNGIEYLERILQETMRKYPAAARLERKCTIPYKIPGSDIQLNSGDIVSIPVYPVHRDPLHYPNPDQFDPDRFTKENIAKRHACAYMPFGLGQRMCVGYKFAMSEGKALVAQLVYQFEIGVTEGTMDPPQFANSFILKPAKEIELKFTPRQSN